MTWAARRIIAAATITAGLLVTAASAATPTEPFTAVFHPRPCSVRCNGTGVIDHYGPVTSIAVISPPTPGPEPGCLTFKGTSTATLVKNRRSTLRIRLPKLNLRTTQPLGDIQNRLRDRHLHERQRKRR